jgi:hypothetical protein
MTTLLLIIASSIAIAFGVIKLVKILSYSEKEEEIVPVENYDLVKSSKSKTKKVTKLKTKK